MTWLDSITDTMDMTLSKLWEILKDRETLQAAVHGVTKSGHDLATEPQQQQISIYISEAKKQRFRLAGTCPKAHY